MRLPVMQAPAAPAQWEEEGKEEEDDDEGIQDSTLTALLDLGKATAASKKKRKKVAAAESDDEEEEEADKGKKGGKRTKKGEVATTTTTSTSRRRKGAAAAAVEKLAAKKKGKKESPAATAVKKGGKATKASSKKKKAAASTVVPFAVSQRGRKRRNVLPAVVDADEENDKTESEDEDNEEDVDEEEEEKEPEGPKSLRSLLQDYRARKKPSPGMKKLSMGAAAASAAAAAAAKKKAKKEEDAAAAAVVDEPPAPPPPATIAPLPTLETATEDPAAGGGGETLSTSEGGEEKGTGPGEEEKEGGEEEDSATATAAAAVAVVGPQVEIVNGQIVINQKSLEVVPRPEEPDETMEEVHEDPQQAATYNSFTTRTKTTRWTAEETRKFYMALRQCGTDFTTMELIFLGSRDRAQLKNKFKKVGFCVGGGGRGGGGSRDFIHSSTHLFACTTKGSMNISTINSPTHLPTHTCRRKGSTGSSCISTWTTSSPWTWSPLRRLLVRRCVLWVCGWFGFG